LFGLANGVTYSKQRFAQSAHFVLTDGVSISALKTETSMILRSKSLALHKLGRPNKIYRLLIPKKEILRSKSQTEASKSKELFQSNFDRNLMMMKDSFLGARNVIEKGTKFVI